MLRGPRTKSRELLSRTNEDETIVSEPDIARVSTVAAQPILVIIMLDAENAQETNRVHDGLHANEETLTFGLIGVLQPKLWSNFQRAEFEAERQRSFDDVPTRSTTLEAKFANRHVDKVEFYLRFTHCEGGVVENVVRPVADVHLRRLKSSMECISSFETRAESNGFPGCEVGRRWNSQNSLTTEETHGTLLSTELLHDSVYLTHGQVGRCEIHYVSLG